MPLAEQTAAIWWALGVGVAFIIFIYTAISGGWFREAGHPSKRTDSAEPIPEAAEETREYPSGFVIEEGNGKVPLVLKVLIVSFLIFLVYYVAQYVIAMNGTLGVFDRYMTQ